MKKVSLVILFALLVVVSSTALTISNDNLELRLFEQNGRFSLYAIQSDGTKKSLLVQDDPRTTILTVLAENKIYRMGDSFEFRQQVAGQGNSASFTWRSASLTVTESFTLQGASLSINVKIENISERDIRIGVRYLFDTYLGEKGRHFTADGLPVETETDYVWATPYEIISSNQTDMQLVIETTDTGITEPDRIVLANWKRLNDAAWSFEANQSRDFNLLPYSINDSAVALYYEPQVVGSGTSRSVTLQMKWEDPSKLIPSSSAGGTPTRISGENSQLREDIRAEMIKIDSLIIQIDTLLDAQTPPNDTTVDAVNGSLQDLEERKKELTGQQ